MKKSVSLFTLGTLLALSGCTEHSSAGTEATSKPALGGLSQGLLTQRDLPLDEPVAMEDPVDLWSSMITQVSDGFLVVASVGTTYRTQRFDAQMQPLTSLPGSFTLPTGLTLTPRLAFNAGHVLMYDVYGRFVALDEDGKPLSATVGALASGISEVNITSTAGGFVAVYGRDGDIFARRLDLNGQPSGTELPVCSVPDAQMAPGIACSGQECLVAWTDYRDVDHADADLYAARIALPSFSVLDTNGVSLANSSLGEASPRITMMGGDYLLVFGYGNYMASMRQRVGEVPGPSRLAQLDYYYTPIDVVPLGENVLAHFNGLVVLIRPDLSGAPFHVVSGGVNRVPSGLASNGSQAAVVFQSAGSSQSAPVYAALLEPSTLGNQPGVLVTRKRNTQARPQIASDGKGYLAVWQDSRGGYTMPFYMARYDLQGNRESDTMSLGYSSDSTWLQPLLDRYVLLRHPTSSRRYWSATIINPSTLTASATTNFSDYYFSHSTNISRGRPDFAGHDNLRLQVWANGTSVMLTTVNEVLARTGTIQTITEAVGDKSDARILWNGNQFLVVWADGRNGDLDLYAARVEADGSVPSRTTVQLTSGPGDDAYPRLAWNGSRYLVAFTHPNPLGLGGLDGITVGEDLSDPTPVQALFGPDSGADAATVLADGARFVVATGSGVKVFDTALNETDAAEIEGVYGAASAGGGQTLVTRVVVDADGYTRGALRMLSRGGAIGSGCDEPADCADGLCVDGVCCTSACAGGSDDCRACSQALGGSSDGVCTLIAGGSTCRAAQGACDSAELCTGTSAECPADLRRATGSVCRPAAGDCDLTERCDGESVDCPYDALRAAGATCRAQASVCDSAETCTGSADCPADAAQPDGTSCSDEFACNGPDSCRAGACAHQPPSCEAPDACHAAACVEPGGCMVVAIAGCCLGDEACADDDPCTEDRCDDHACTHEPILDCGVPGDDAGGPVSEHDAGMDAPEKPDAGAVEQDDDPATGMDPPPASSKDGGCSIATPQPGASTPWLWSLALLGLLGWRRRRLS